MAVTLSQYMDSGARKTCSNVYMCGGVHIYVMIIIKGDTKTLGAGCMGGVGGE